MENTSDNGQSRGVLRLEKTEEVLNTILENSEDESDSVPMYSVDNSELDSLLNEAASTKAENEQQGKSEQSQEQQQKPENISAQEAMALAIAGLSQLTKIASDYTGKEIVLGELPQTIFAVLTAPLIQKYKPKMDIDPKNVDLESWVPELMALGGVGVVGLPIWLQTKDDSKKEAVKSGN